MDFLSTPRPLDPFFKPKSVAVIGATDAPGSIGRTLLWNLLSSPFDGMVLPIHPTREHVLGVECRRTLRAIEKPVDLAIIASERSMVPLAVQDCLVMGARAIIITSAGEVPLEYVAAARQKKIRILGPDSLGIASPATGLNASYAAAMPKAGNVAFLSQSGALCTAVLDWGARHKVGFSAFVSTGSMADIDWGELLDHFAADTKTRSILTYIESITDARAFLSAAREAALAKPILALSPGDDPLLDAAFQRCGVLRVKRIADLFYMADVLAKQPRPAGPRLKIVTNAGAPAALAVDALPVSVGLADPVDLGNDATPERYAKAVEEAAKDETADGLLVIFAPQVTADPVKTAENLRTQAKFLGKPVLASWMGGDLVENARQLLTEAGIPVFPFPDTAARAFHYLWMHGERQRALYETPMADESAAADRAEAGQTITAARAQQRTWLEDAETARVFAAYGIRVDAAAPAGFDLYLGSRVDHRFGPYLIAGLGGKLGSVIPDQALGLPPLNTTLARRMLEQTQVYQGLAAGGADLAELEQVLVRFSSLIAEQPWIAEVDIAPLVLGSGGVCARSARIRLHRPSFHEAALPRLAIRPYPAQYMGRWMMKSGDIALVRPIRPEDEPLMVRFHESLSDRTVYMRYLHMMKLEMRISHERLTRICFNDYDRELALVAETDVAGERRVLGVGRLQRLRQKPEEAEIAVVVADAFQGLGLGSELLRRLVDVGRQEKVKRLWADILADNSKMRRLCESMGFKMHAGQLDDPTVTGCLDLAG